MVKKLTYIVLFLLLSAYCYAQQPVITAGVWKFTSFYGDINLNSYYRGRETSYNQSNEFQQSTYFSGGINLKTRSYFWHPKFISLDINAVYSPEMGNEQFLVAPDRSEVRTLKKLDLRTTLFKRKKITLNAFANFSQNISTREYLTDLNSINKRWGSQISYRNKVLPVSVSYSQNIWDQEEIASGRVFRMDQKNFLAKANKSFSKFDFHELSYSHDEYIRQDGDFTPIQNNIDYLFLKNTVYFDTQKKYSLRSIITQFNQEGSYTFNRFQANEFINLRLPKNFSFIGNYQFYNEKRETQSLKQNRIKATIKHQLFSSLKTNAFFEYYTLNQSVYDESNLRTGIDIRYTKKIPKGQLTLAYKYYRHHQNMDAQTNYVNEINEEQILTDGQIVILNRPYIEQATITVKDITGTIIYQLNFDYILIERNNFTEIQRLPGGQIPNNESVYIDYTAMLPGSYEFNANNNIFSANVLMFKRLIELYFRTAKLDYPSFQNVDHLTLNRYTQTVVGGRVDIKFARIGVEYDNYNSNIIPYRMVRYYINLQKTFRKKILCSLNGNIRDYEKTIDKIPQQFTDISAKVAYRFKLQTMLSVEAGYRNQNGDGINLDLFTGKSEFETNYRQMAFKVGINVYRRNHLNDKIYFNNVYAKIIRKFKL